MWCGACQQDVPGVAASASDPSICCARCGKPVRRSLWLSGQLQTSPCEPERSAELFSSAADKVPFEDLPEFVELEDWEFEETIQEVQRLVRSVTRVPELGLANLPQQRTDGPHLRQPLASSRRSPKDNPPAISSVGQATTSLPWILLAVGLGVFVCGAALVGLSLVNQRPQLWQLGLPMVLGGQVAILAVVIWQLDIAWNSHRATFVALHAMDDQLRRLREDWSPRQQGEKADPCPSHPGVAEDAGADVLLADLKQQIDVLSTRLAHDKHAA